MVAIQNQRQLLRCSRCGNNSVSTDYHVAGMTLICLTCGNTAELTPTGEPYQPPKKGEGTSAGHVGPRFPRGLRTTVFDIYVTPRPTKRGTVDWWAQPPVAFKMAVNYYSNQAGNRWRIYSAESKPTLPDTLTDQDLTNLQQLLRDLLTEMLEAQGNQGNMTMACTWEIDPWGHLTRMIEND